LVVQPSERALQPEVANERRDVPVRDADVVEQRAVAAVGSRVDGALELVEEGLVAVAKLLVQQPAAFLGRELAAEIAPQVARERAEAAQLNERHVPLPPCTPQARTAAARACPA
jgi:hypothetical protein